MRLGAWRPALRIARRDLARHKGRNALIALMVGMPVLAVSTFATIYETSSLTTVEELPLQLGTTQAQVIPVGHDPLDQNPQGEYATVDPTGVADPASWTATQLRAAVGSPLIDVTTGPTSIRTAHGRLTATLIGVEGGSPDLAGFVQLRSGRFPRADSEVLVSPSLAQSGLTVGQQIDLADPTADVTATAATVSARVVGTGIVPSNYLDTLVVAPPGSPSVALLDPSEVTHTYLVPGDQPITWSRVRELNHEGLAVISRAVVQHPPTNWEQTLANPDAFSQGGSDPAVRAVLTLVVFSIVLEVVLLAGPAFAVGVRRQRRQLALIAATGGTPRDVRRIVLAQGLVCGALAAAVAAALSVPLSGVIVWAILRMSPTTTLGPFDVAWIPLLIATALGAVAAVTAAYFPARAASRLDVVAVLAGRRGQVRSRRGLPVVGALLLVGGAGLALARGTRPGGEFFVAAGTLTMVLGAVASMPAVVGGVGRLGARLPLPLRLAARDSARQRGRTAPAVAAVMAAVAGVTTLAIGASSDFAQSRRDYEPTLPSGVSQITVNGVEADWWATAAQDVTRVAPGRTLLATGTIGPADSGTSTSQVYVALPGCPATPPPEEGPEARERCTRWMTGGEQDDQSTSTNNLVASPEAIELLGYRLDDTQRATLDDGGVLVPSPALLDDTGHVRLTTYRLNFDDGTTSNIETHVVPGATFAPARWGKVVNLTGTIVTPQTAEKLHLGWTQTGGVLSASATPLTRATQDVLQETLLGSAPYADVYTERGFDESFTLPLLGLAVIAALAVLVGTLTATGLALADSRPDAATLAAIGAPPRTRRALAAAQAMVIGLLGSVTGIAVGAVPGLAVTWPLTAQHSGPDGSLVWGTPVIDIPWVVLLVIGVGVPVLAAAVAGLGVRSRLPLTRRFGQ